MSLRPEVARFFATKWKDFKSRRLALAHMIGSQSKAGDIKRMRRGLGDEGWWYKCSMDEKQIKVITDHHGLPPFR